MTELVEKVAKIIDLDDCTATERAKAAIAVVLKEIRHRPGFTIDPVYLRHFARENGVSLDE